MRLQKRMNKKRVAIKGKNRIPSLPIVSIMMPRIKSTSISPKLCSLPGTNFLADPAITINTVTNATTTHMMMTALLMEISSPPNEIGM